MRDTPLWKGGGLGAGNGSRSFPSHWWKLFTLLVLGDVMAFLITLGLLAALGKQKQKRLIKIGPERKSRSGKRTANNHSLRKILLVCLYVQGTCEVYRGSQPDLYSGSTYAHMSQADVEEASLMSAGGNGTHQNDNVYAPPSTSVYDDRGAVLQGDEDQLVTDSEDEEGTQSPISTQGDDGDDRFSQESMHSVQQEVGDQEARQDTELEPGRLTIDQVSQIVQDESPDWVHLYQFRRNYDMRHCFTRMTNFAREVGAVAQTWDASRDDVLQIHLMPVNPRGIPARAQAVVVQLWGDDFRYDTRESVLLDLIYHAPPFFRDGPVLSRNVAKFPPTLTRQRILEEAGVAGQCHVRRNKCLVQKNLALLPLQDVSTIYPIESGDYFVIELPPVEECMTDIELEGLSLLQTGTRVRKGVNKVCVEFRALGNAEDAPRDSDSIGHRPELPEHHNFGCRHQLDNVSERSSMQVSIPEADSGQDNVSVDEESDAQDSSPFREPTEGLPDPGNPTQISLDQLISEQESSEKHEVTLRLDPTWGLLWKLFQPWTQSLNLDIPREASPSPLALQYLSDCAIGLEGCQQLYIFTDGSYSPQNEVAAFALTIFGTNQETKERHYGGWLGGVVRLDGQSGDYTGAAQHSAGEAEVSAMIWTLAWLLQENFQGTVELCYDSKVAGCAADGQWKCDHNWGQLCRLREIAQLYDRVKIKGKMEYTHVKAHSGQPQNELVDALAKFCGTSQQGRNGDFLPEVDWSPLFCNDQNILPWAWWIYDSLSGAHHQPRLQQEMCRWQIGKSMPQVQNLELPGDISTEEVHFNIRVGSYIMSFRSSSATSMAKMLSQTAQHCFATNCCMLDITYVVGLQETRSNRNTIYQAEDFIRVVSGDESGHHGCEIWFNRRLPFARCQDAKHYVEVSRITVLYHDPRQLFVKLQIGGAHLIVASLHAPHENTEVQIKEIWWKNFNQRLHRFRQQGKCILLGDFNARIGGQDGIHVGDLAEGLPNHNGDYLEMALQDHELWLPSTFSGVHSGLSRTWIHPKGTTARLDYVVLDLCVKECATWSLVDEQIQVPNNTRDHLLIGNYLGWTEKKGSGLTKKRISYDWPTMHTAEGKRHLQRLIQDLPEVSWDVDAHTHWQILEDHLHASLQEAFPAARRPTRSDMFTAQSWKYLEQRRRLRANLDTWDDCYDRFNVQLTFKAWRDGTGLDMVLAEGRLRSYGLLCLRGALLSSFRAISKRVRKSAAEDKAKYIETIGHYVAGASNSDVFKALKRLRVGSAFRKRSLVPLPFLQDEQTGTAMSWEERDERWRSHCARMEAGVTTTTMALTERAIEGSFRRVGVNSNHTLKDVPTLRDLEDAFRRVRPNKAAGLDNLRSDLCCLAPTALAGKYFPILAKMTLNYCEPIQMKGGVLIAAYKSGSPHNIDHYRSLLLSSHIGKSLRRTLRQRMTHLYTNTAPSLHVSVKAGGNVCHASQALRCYIDACKAGKRSVAVMFLDIKSAYYRVVRQLAANMTYCDEDVARVLSAFDLGPTDFDELRQELAKPSALKQSGADAHTELVVEEMLQSTWFVTSEKRLLTESLAGTRPGDIFSFVFKKVMAQVSQHLHECFGWTMAVPNTEVNIATQPTVEVEIPPMVEVVWADDLALAVSDLEATRTVTMIQEAVSTTFRACLKHGLQPNLSKNKTEVMLILRGAKSRSIKAELYNRDVPMLPLQNLPEDFDEVRLTGGYRHLGHRIVVGDSIGAEVRSRTGQAAGVFRQYRRQVFQNGRVPLERRKFLFNTLVMSILRYNLGTWPHLHPRCFAHFRKKVFAMYRGLVRATIPEMELRVWNNDKILEFVGLPDPQTILHEARLRYSITLLQHGPSMLWHLLNVEQGWLRALREDIYWMDGQLQGYGPDRYGNGFNMDWDALFRHKPAAGRNWIGKAVRHASIQKAIYTQWTEWHHEFLQTCSEAGLDLQYPWTTLTTEEKPDSKGSLDACLLCGLLFRSKAAWSVHAFKKHGRVNWRRHYISGSRCEGCLREYGTSERLQNHLTYSSRCAALIKRHLEPVPLRPGRNNTRRDRDPPLAIPVLQAEGPCRLWNTEDGENDEEGIDLELIEQLMDVLERNFESDPEKVADITIAELVTHYKNALCTTWADFGTVRHTVKRFREEALQDADDRDIRAMSLVQDLLRLRWFFTDEDLEKLEVDLPDASLRENAWRYCQEAKKSPSWNVTAFKPSIIFRDFVIVHLFSGERRENDLESYLNQIEAPKNSIKVILSVDIIYDHQRANLANGSVQRQWINFILNGLIAILYVGPPCESWSAARALGGIAGHTAGDGGPRALRTTEYPYGLPAMKVKEALQIQIANVLLTFSLMAMLCMATVGRMGVLEHPAPSDEAWIASTWKLQITRILTAHPAFRQYLIHQGVYGGHSPKPTTLLICADDHDEVAAILRFYAQTAMPQALRMGKDSSTGCFNTAKLKNYPPLLCKALAALAEGWGQRNFGMGVHGVSHEPFLAYVERLRRHYNESAAMGPDYAA